MSVGTRFEALNAHYKAQALRAPTSEHHWRAVAELWPLVEPLGCRTALEVGAGEPPYLTARMLAEHGLAVQTLDAVSECSLPGDLHDIPAADGAFDLGVARHVLEHALSPHLALAELARVARWLLVVVPYPSVKSRDWPDHLWHLSQCGWERVFLKCGLRVEHCEVGDHTEQYAIDGGLWRDLELRYLLTKSE